MLSELIPHITLSMPKLAWPDFELKDVQAELVLGAFAILFSLESRWAHRKSAGKTMRQSYMANLGTFILNDTLLSLLSVSSLWVLAEHYSGWGILNFIDSPFWESLAAFLLLDLTLYLWHYACHQVEWLWLFHRVHHSDLCMNVSTAFRTHFVEIFLTTVVKAVFVVLTGVETQTLLLSEALITVFVMFHHANLQFPGERLLAWLTIVPYLHRVHHSVQRQEHDSNYGAFFSIWDRLFGTLGEREPAQLGLKQVPGQGVIELMLFGFKPLSPAPAPQATVNVANVRKMIEEAAYYRAEKRGFAPGFEFNDWFEAEKEMRNRTRSCTQ